MAFPPWFIWLWSAKFIYSSIILAHIWEFSKCHGLVGVQSLGKWTKYQALPELIWWLPELIFQFFAVLIFFSDDLYKCLLVAAVSHVSGSAAVFVTRMAMLHSLLFITLIPHYYSRFVMCSASTMTTDNWNERNKCYHLPLSVYFHW